MQFESGNSNTLTLTDFAYLCSQTKYLLIYPFPQIDIIRAMVIVWRVREKIIRSVLWNIVCNNCAQCIAHTYEADVTVLWIEFCLTGPISLYLDSFLPRDAATLARSWES